MNPIMIQHIAADRVRDSHARADRAPQVRAIRAARHSRRQPGHQGAVSPRRGIRIRLLPAR